MTNTLRNLEIPPETSGDAIGAALHFCCSDMSCARHPEAAVESQEDLEQLLGA
jgi:hypothetical protein